MKKILTLCIIHKNNQVLLGMKKRGFGEGKWNGFGGKVEARETLEQAAVREMREESGLNIDVTKKDKVGVLQFLLQEDTEHLEVHIYRLDKYSGVPVETDEMLPAWFNIEDIPYDQMWEDDKDWLPLFLEGKKFEGEYSFDKNNCIIESNLNIVSDI